jgi:ABC-type multidrug transport system ATPase subunit
LGKSTLLKIITGHLAHDSGKIEWGHETHVGYFAQDHKEQLTDPSKTTLDYLWDICPQEGTSFVRGLLGRLLFSGDDVNKRVGSLSGGEATRLVFSRLMVQKPNVLALDEPTNHLDLEAIEALVSALSSYEGTLIFVSHDRWFVSELATRVIEILPDGLHDFAGSYQEYLERQGDDHLDVDQVELRAKRQRKLKEKPPAPRAAPGGNRNKSLPKQRDSVLERVSAVEAQLARITARYCEPGYFERTPAPELERLKSEQASLEQELLALTEEWESLEAEIARQSSDLSEP